MTTIVNLYGGPGSGKSTMAAAVFAELKWLGVNCELVTEYAKTKVWEESFRVFESQFFVSANQIYNIQSVAKHVDLIITDSPILMRTAYTDKEDKILLSLIKSEHSKYNNINIFLNRVKPYNPNGRMQSEAEAIQKDKEILEILEKSGEGYIRCNGEREAIPSLLDAINLVFLSKRGVIE